MIINLPTKCIYVTAEQHISKSFTYKMAAKTSWPIRGKVFPYSLPSVGPGADPGVQAVSPQVT